MKKSEGFNIPQRQSKWAIIFIIIRFIKRLALQIWPILIALFLGRSSNSFDRLELIVAGMGILGMITSIIAYFRYYYHISDTELIIRRGLFNRIKLNIPFERIQSINFKQNVLHQLLNVTELDIDTAGSKEKELQIDALSISKAEQLRAILLQKKSKANPSLALEVDQAMESPEKEQILALSDRDLIKVGLSQNHFKPIGLLIGFIFSLYAYSYTIDVDPMEIFEFIWKRGSALDFLELTILTLLIIPGLVLYSIIRVYLNYYKLQFWRQESKFQVMQGLFTRQEFAAVDKKIQILSWSQNLLERAIGFYNLHFRQASSGTQREEKTRFMIPGCDEKRIRFVMNAWIGEKKILLDHRHTVSIHYFYHGAFYFSLFSAIGIAISLFLTQYFASVIILGMCAFLIYYRWVSYKKKIYVYSNEVLYTGGGAFGFSHSIMPLSKVQNISITQNPYQWRRNLASLVVFTAGGPLVIPYIDEQKAKDLLDFLIYQVEISKKPWM